VPAGTKIAAKSYLVFGRTKDKTKNGGVDVDVAYDKAINLSNTGKDGLIISLGGKLIEEVIYDTKSGWVWVSGRSMNLASDKIDAKANDDAANWCGATTVMASTDLGTPGAENTKCDYADVDKDGVADDKDNCKNFPNPSQKDADKNGVGDDCEGDAPLCGNGKVDTGESCDDHNKWSGDGCSDHCQKESKIAEGALIITEFNANPKAVADAKGEWVEIHNTTNADIDVQGLLLVSSIGKGSYKASISGLKPIIIKAGGYRVFTVNPDTKTNGGLPDDAYPYAKPNASSKLSLASTKAAKLSLVSQGVTVDAISYDPATWPIKSGLSTSLSATVTDFKGNDNGGVWCHGMYPYGAGDLGTPGKANHDCALMKDPATVDPDKDGVPASMDNCKDKANANQKDGDDDGFGDVCDNCPNDKNASQADKDKNGVGDVCDIVAPKLAKGDLLITEIMAKSAAGGGDKGEWVELHNTTGSAIDLRGLVLKYVNPKGSEVAAKIDTKAGASVVPANGYAVLARVADPASNGGVSALWSWGGNNLNNDGGTLLLLAGDTEVDKVQYNDKKPWPVLTTGASFQLKTGAYDATKNDDGANWCLSANAWGGGLKGTPGKANDCK